MRSWTLAAKHELGGLDGLRGLGCLAVIAAHCSGRFAPDTTPAGVAQVLGQALTVFFALSGFLIYLPFASDILRGDRRVRLGHYAARRTARIFPAYVLIFLIANLLHGVYVTNAVDTGRPFSAAGTGMIHDPLALALNLTLTQSLLPEHLQTGINPSWSLTTELTFYALLPVLAVPLVARAHSVRGRILTAMVPAGFLLVVGIAGRTWAERLHAARPALDAFSAEYGANWIAVLSRSLLGLADNFALGMIVAVLFLATRQGHLPAWTRGRAATVGWTLFVAGGVAGFLLHDTHPWLTGSATSISAAALVLIMVDPAARSERSWLVKLAGLAPFEFVGLISLSTYLWHFPVMIWLTRAGVFVTDSWGSMLGSWLAVAAASIALGAVSYRLVEMRFLRMVG